MKDTDCRLSQFVDSKGYTVEVKQLLLYFCLKLYICSDFVPAFSDRKDQCHIKSSLPLSSA